MTPILSNVLKLTILLDVDSSKVKLSSLSSEELPWLEDSGEPYGYQLRVIIEEQLLVLLNSSKSLGQKLVPTIELMLLELAKHLREALEICCEFRPNFVLEELEEGALNALCERLKITDIESTRVAIAAIGTLNWKPSETVSKEKAREADIASKLKVLETKHDAAPGSTVGLTLLNEHDFPLRVESIRLLHGDKCILEHSSSKELPTGKPVAIHMAAIPVRHYGPLSESGQQLDIVIAFSGAPEPVRLDASFPVDRPLLEKSPASLFFDMGSSQFKQMLVDLATPPAGTDFDPNFWASETGTRLAASGTHAKCFQIPPPRPTGEMIDHFGLPEFRKEQIDQFDDLQLAAHFARAIQIVARYYHSRNRRLIAEFYWAFPNVSQRDFKSINEIVNQQVGTSILGKIMIVEESECLRRHFAAPLNGLGTAASQAVSDVRDKKDKKRALEADLNAARAAWDDYKQRNLFQRFFTTITGNRPQQPDNSGLAAFQIPTLKDWHRKFSAIVCYPNLSDYLVFDAGGYTLDVYGSIEAESGRFSYSKSFNAGSNLITHEIRKKLAEKRNQAPEEIDAEEAERLKLQYCSEGEVKASVLSMLCKDATRQIYHFSVDRVIDWLLEHKFQKGFPVILSGGGSRNQHLRDLLSEHLERHRIRTVPVDSNLIYGTLQKVECAHTQMYLLFSNVVSGFNLDDELPRYSPLTDVVGGLAAVAISDSPAKKAH